MHNNKQNLENDTLILVLSIASIPLCFCCFPLGLIFALVALLIANKQLNLVKNYPESYNPNSDIVTGRIIAIVGLIINLFVIFASILYLVIIALFSSETKNILDI